MTAFQIQTCSEALLGEGRCCQDACDALAIYAALDSELIEHALCVPHLEATEHGWLAFKDLVWAEVWKP